MWHMGVGWGWWMLMGWIWIILIIAFSVWATYVLTGPLRAAANGRQPSEPGALEILERRYARGELTDEQFESMRERLSRSSTARAA